jgi:hypothetical protein
MSCSVARRRGRTTTTEIPPRPRAVSSSGRPGPGRTGRRASSPVRLHSSENWFGSHSRLYDNRDTDSVEKGKDSAGKPIMPRAHVHEIGHLLGFGHVDEAGAALPSHRHRGRREERDPYQTPAPSQPRRPRFPCRSAPRSTCATAQRRRSCMMRSGTHPGDLVTRVRPCQAGPRESETARDECQVRLHEEPGAAFDLHDRGRVAR